MCRIISNFALETTEIVYLQIVNIEVAQTAVTSLTTQ